MEEKYASEPMNFKKWVANFWYYYKWMFITAVIFLVFIIICTVQYFSAEEYDASILFVGSDLLSPTVCDSIRESTAEIMSGDYNGDSEKIVDLKTINLSSDYDELISDFASETQSEALKDYNNELLAGDFCIMLLDPYFYDQLKANGTLYLLPGNVSYGARLGDLKISAMPGYCNLDRDTVLCIRYPGSAGKTTDSEKEDIFERNYLVLQDILFYEGK